MVQVVRCHTTGVGALTMVPVSTPNQVLLQEGGIHAEVDLKDNSDMEVLSREATSKVTLFTLGYRL